MGPEGPRPAALLCDADDCLFGSERPAFAAATAVTNAFLESMGSDARWEPEELRRHAAGRSFRANAILLAAELGLELDPDELEGWVVRERDAVVAHLAATLRPDPAVTEPLERLRDAGVLLAVVSSSALARLDACFRATGLSELLPPERRFSAEDSLPVPTSKPDPAVYRHAVEALGLTAADCLAVEDSVSGVRSAVGAGVPVVGNLLHVPAEEREERRAALLRAGAREVLSGWDELLR